MFQLSQLGEGSGPGWHGLAQRLASLRKLIGASTMSQRQLMISTTSVLTDHLNMQSRGLLLMLQACRDGLPSKLVSHGFAATSDHPTEDPHRTRFWLKRYIRLTPEKVKPSA